MIPRCNIESCSSCLFIHNDADTEGYITILAESFRPCYASVQRILASLAEPVSRPPLVHEYRLTPFSLGTAVSNGLDAQAVMDFVGTYAYDFHDPASVQYARLKNFVKLCMECYNLARIVVEQDQGMVQCKNMETAERLLGDAGIQALASKPPTIHKGISTSGESTDTFFYFVLQSRAVCKMVAARCVLLGIPIQQQYEFEQDRSVRSASMTLRVQTKPRPYQIEALEAATTGGTLKSGCLVLPCGAGKTLLGIMLMCKLRKPTLVVCAGSVSVEQWRTQILDYATFEPSFETVVEEAGLAGAGRGRGQRGGGAAPRSEPARVGTSYIACLTGKQKDPITADTEVVITTYSMLVSAHRAHVRRGAQQRVAGALPTPEPSHPAHEPRAALRERRQLKEQLFASYGLLLLDEVHMIPAEAFRESLSFVDAKGVIGLTATYVREDHKILDLFHLVGPKLYDVSMETLAAQGYLAKVNCFEVHTPMTREFAIEYLDRRIQDTGLRRSGKASVQVLLAAANPNKMLCVRELVARHLDQGSKILVFCDHILLLQEYGKLLGVPVISGKTQHRDRLMIFSDFQSTSKVNVICISRVGDVSVNLPSANVVIQVSSHGGSRRQEAQRLGRILRPKERASSGHAVEAWFYSIISTDTLEMGHAARRTAFLVDQGYACRVIAYEPPCVKPDAPGGVKTESTNANAPDGLSPAQQATPGHGSVGLKHDPVGDLASIKQERLHEGLAGRGPARGAPGRSTGAVLASEAFFPASQLAYQLELLSRVVASWELEYQKLKRRRAEADAQKGVNQEDQDEEEEDAVLLDREARSYQAIKKEWGDWIGSREELELGLRAGSSRKQRDSLLIHDLVGADDDFVYHEL